MLDNLYDLTDEAVIALKERGFDPSVPIAGIENRRSRDAILAAWMADYEDFKNGPGIVLRVCCTAR